MDRQLHHFTVFQPAERFLRTNVSRCLNTPEIERKNMYYRLIIQFNNRNLFRLEGDDHFTSNTGKMRIWKLRRPSNFCKAEDLIPFFRKIYPTVECFQKIQTSSFVPPDLVLDNVQDGSIFEFEVIFKSYDAIMPFYEFLSVYCDEIQVSQPEFLRPQMTERQKHNIQAIYYRHPMQYMSFPDFINAANSWPPLYKRRRRR